ncbi:Holliday junction DNA helicase, RuvB subunit [Paractinoplanes atraurantiacus]|uniref:Holliday junction branch migration complex subunit RuvB n=1 Tax=Paractinoplanes atraurantiacus TaxID=1036182 RepID=A0A285J6J2_9ACTN|nr:Holliday junction DNA helicase, RuvB subunit [Actinoplanes atraurantiacus]
MSDLVSADAGDEDLDAEASVRPRRLAEFIAQHRVRDQLDLLLKGAMGRGAPPDHILLSGPPGLGKPVQVDALVLMVDGSRRRLGDVVVGDQVITRTGEPAEVLAVHEQGELDSVRIRTASGREVVAAPDHPFWTTEGWVKAGDLTPADVVANVLEPETVADGTEQTDEFRLAGYMIGDGCTSNQVTFTGSDPAVMDDFRAVCDRLGHAHNTRPNSARSELIRVSGLMPWLRQHGLIDKTAWTKRVPEFVFLGDTWQISAFLAAYFACDGTVSRRGRDRYDLVIEYYSVSRGLLEDTQHLLLRLGIQSRLKLKRGRYQGRPHESWRLSITSQDDAARFAERVTPIGSRGERLREWAPRRDRFDERLAPDRVTSVEPAGLAECRCLTVAGDHTFTVNDLVVHNTTLANIVAAELGTSIRTTSGPVIERSGDLAAILTSLAPGDVLFIDEIHRIAKPAEELLYSAMEDFRVDVVVGKGPGATAIPLDVEPFTLVGATTRAGLLSGPMRDRFGFVAHLDFYSPADLDALLHRSARILGVPITDEGAAEIAGRSRGTPRIANRLLRRVRDFAEVRADGVVTESTARAALKVYDVDELGLDRLDRAVLRALIESFRGGPVGLSTLAVAVGEQSDTVEEVCEPFLVRAGLLARTPRGRVATEAGWVHLGKTPPSGVIQGDLFARDA